MGTLWAQHGENRVFFQNLITLGLAHVAHYNVLIDVYLSAFFLLGAAALLILTHHRRSPSIPWLAYRPVAILLLSVAQWGGALYGYSIGWYIIMMALSIALFFLDRPVLTWVALCAAALAGIVASFSSLQGLFVWPAGLVLLLQRARPRPFVLGWVAAGVTSVGIYFYNWDPQQGGSISYALHHLVQTLKFFFFAVGDVVGVQLPDAPHGAQYGVFVLGVAIVGIGIWSIVRSGFRVDVSSARPVGVALTWFGLLFAAGAAGGRASLGLSNAGSSLYVIFDVLILVGSYLVVLDRSKQDASNASQVARWLPGMTLAISVLIGFQVIFGTANGISNANSYRDFQVTGAIIAANIQRAPDGLVFNDLGAGYESPRFIRNMTAYARVHRLSLFSTSKIDWYSRQSLPLNRTPPTTSLAKPTGGEAIRGSSFLVASASDPFGVTKVQFVLSGNDQRSMTISEGVNTPYGWIGAWNTTTVPDGDYLLRSIAYSPGGLRGMSPFIDVKVAN